MAIFGFPANAWALWVHRKDMALTIKEVTPMKIMFKSVFWLQHWRLLLEGDTVKMGH